MTIDYLMNGQIASSTIDEQRYQEMLALITSQLQTAKNFNLITTTSDNGEDMVAAAITQELLEFLQLKLTPENKESSFDAWI